MVVAEIEIRDDPEHSLFFFFLDLYICQFFPRESNDHLGDLRGNDQHDQRRD